MQVAVDDLELTDFEYKIGLTATVAVKGQPGLDIALELKDATAIESAFPKGFSGTKPPDFRETPFSLIFIGPRYPLLPAGVYEMQMQLLGTISIFVNPTGQDEISTTYQAVFT